MTTDQLEFIKERIRLAHCDTGLAGLESLVDAMVYYVLAKIDEDIEMNEFMEEK